MGELGLVASGAGLAYGIAKRGARHAFVKELKSELSHSDRSLAAAERISKAEGILGRELSPAERQAVIRAHEAGENAIGSYSSIELREKAGILKDAGFDHSERRQLVEEGVVGRERAAPPGQ